MVNTKAENLVVGMCLTDGQMVVDVETRNGGVDVTLSSYDYESGEVDYFPMFVPLNYIFEVEGE